MDGGEIRGRAGAAGDVVVLNLCLVAEVEYIAELDHMTKHGRVDGAALARAAEMSEAGLVGILRTGAMPRVDTLHKLAVYARRFDHDYSVVRPYRAAGWLTHDDVVRYLRDEGIMRQDADVLVNEAIREEGLDEEDEREILRLADHMVRLAERLRRGIAREKAASPSVPSPAAPGE